VGIFSENRKDEKNISTKYTRISPNGRILSPIGLNSIDNRKLRWYQIGTLLARSPSGCVPFRFADMRSSW
jgi:hypothetical protein